MSLMILFVVELLQTCLALEVLLGSEAALSGVVVHRVSVRATEHESAATSPVRTRG